MVKSRIIKATRKNFQVLMPDGVVIAAVLTGKAIKDDMIKVGDWVDVEPDPQNENQVLIKKIRKRFSTLSRGRGYKTHTIVSNIDQILILMSAKTPDFRQSLLDRYLIIAERNKIPAIICLNKVDLVDPVKYEKIRDYYSLIGYRLIFTSAKADMGIDDLKKILQDKTTALIGHSGVGKSSLIMRIEPGLDIHTQEVSQKTKKGRHTTTHSQLYPLSYGANVIDTPGIKELGIGDILKKELMNYFVEFSEYGPDCKFSDCMHENEPGCALIEAASGNPVLKQRHKSYLQILKDLPAYEYEWDQGKVAPV